MCENINVFLPKIEMFTLKFVMIFIFLSYSSSKLFKIICHTIRKIEIMIYETKMYNYLNKNYN